MSIIEQRINKNKELFDVYEPIDGHFDRFQDKLQKLHKVEKISHKSLYLKVLKVAASVIILLSVSFALFLYNNGYNNLFASKSSPELNEATEFYTAVTEQKLAKIEELSKNDVESEKLKDSALKSVNALKTENKELEKEYFVTNQDTRVFGAIINNYRLLATALDRVIENMNDIREKKSGTL